MALIMVSPLSGVEPALRQQLAVLPDADVQASVAIAGHSEAGRGTFDTRQTSPKPVTESAMSADSKTTIDLPLPTTPTGCRYRIVRRHAKGGLGEVFVAEDTELGRHIALKEIQARHADRADFRRRFILEAEITGGLEHPGIVPVYGLGRYADGRPFYAMRFIKGDDLREAVRRFHGLASVEPSGRRGEGVRHLTPRA